MVKDDVERRGTSHDQSVAHGANRTGKPSSRQLCTQYQKRSESVLFAHILTHMLIFACRSMLASSEKAGCVSRIRGKGRERKAPVACHYLDPN